MADSTKPERPRRVASKSGSPAVADDGDVAFGGMAGAGILGAILVAFFVSAGIVGYNPEPAPVGSTTATTAGDVAETTVPDTVVEEVVPEEVSTSAEATIEVSDDGIILKGTLPTQEMADSIRAAAAESFNSDQISDNLSVLDGATDFSVTSSGSVTDPILFSTMTEALAAAVAESGIDGSYVATINLEAQVDASLNELVELEPILFQTGTAEIDAASLPTVDRAAEILKAFPGARVEIGGHTDSTGDPTLNQPLSQARAEAVLSALLERGVDAELTAVGYGSDAPVADNATPEGREQNRRIEFRAL